MHTKQQNIIIENRGKNNNNYNSSVGQRKNEARNLTDTLIHTYRTHGDVDDDDESGAK